MIFVKPCTSTFNGLATFEDSLMKVIEPKHAGGQLVNTTQGGREASWVGRANCSRRGAMSTIRSQVGPPHRFLHALFPGYFTRIPGGQASGAQDI